jgi:hypothetical protein
VVLRAVGMQGGLHSRHVIVSKLVLWLVNTAFRETGRHLLHCGVSHTDLPGGQCGAAGSRLGRGGWQTSCIVELLLLKVVGMVVGCTRHRYGLPCCIGVLWFVWHIAVCTEGLIWNKHACYPLLNNRSIEG